MYYMVMVDGKVYLEKAGYIDMAMYLEKYISEQGIWYGKAGYIDMAMYLEKCINEQGIWYGKVAYIDMIYLAFEIIIVSKEINYVFGLYNKCKMEIILNNIEWY